MKFAFAMPHLTRLKATSQPWERLVTGADQQRIAKRADALGFDMMSVPEHFIIPQAHVELSGPHYFHAAAGQGFFAGATERILINSSIAILPLQHPIVTAKALSTIDWMSTGRIIATFGVGWLTTGPRKQFPQMTEVFDWISIIHRLRIYVEARPEVYGSHGIPERSASPCLVPDSMCPISDRLIRASAWPTICPSCMTSMRSLNRMISSKSIDTSRIAFPASCISINFLLTKSEDTMSRPRVG